MSARPWLLVACSAALLLIFGPAASRAQRGQSDRESNEEIAVLGEVEDFLYRLARRDLEDAYNQLLVGSPFANQKEQVEQLTARTEMLLAAYGDFVGIERIDVRRVGQSLAYVRYLYKTEELPVVWFFTYYQVEAGANWKLVAVRFDTNLETLIGTAAATRGES